jgi:hypothetical protein
MAQGVVDQLEPVQVAEEDGEPLVRTRAGQQGVELLGEQHPVGQAGQRVVGGLVPDGGQQARLLQGGGRLVGSEDVGELQDVEQLLDLGAGRLAGEEAGFAGPGQQTTPDSTREAGVECRPALVLGGEDGAGSAQCVGELAAVGEGQQLVTHRGAAGAGHGEVQGPPGTRRLPTLTPAGGHAAHVLPSSGLSLPV